MKKTLLAVLAVLALLAVPLSFLMFYGMGDIRKLVIRDVDLSKVADGTYTGSYHKGRWTYDVQVSVKDHRITAVKNTNQRTGAQKEWNRQAEARILEKQAIDVDIVSGATLNSKAFEKAVEIALATPARH
jgi:uncharacterized protein with FMN-binding domain